MAKRMNVALKYVAVAFVSSAAAFAAVNQAGALGTEACPAPSALMSCPQQAQPHPAPWTSQLAQSGKQKPQKPQQKIRCINLGWEHCKTWIALPGRAYCAVWKAHCIEAGG